jgi:hypothetical protein
MDITSLVPRVLKRDFQKQLMNFASLSNMIDWGRPCNLKTWSKKMWVVSGVVAMVWVGTKCTIFGEGVYENDNGIETILGDRELHDEVHGHLFPGGTWCGERL